MSVVTHSQRYRSTSLPFRYQKDGIGFTIDAYSLDGRKPRDLELRPGERTIDVAPGSRGESVDTNPDIDHWDELTLYGRLEISEGLVERVFPPEERDAPPAKLYVAVRCHETIYRARVAERSAPVEPGVYDVSIDIKWEDVRGVVELRPYFVRTTRSDAEGKYATDKNVRVASGDRYEVVVDYWDADEPAAIDGEETSFSRADHLPDGDVLYHLDFRDESRPKLWINADNPRITDVLQTGGSVGAEPRLRDVVLDQISQGVWTQLILQTAAGIDEDGEVEYDWQRNVLETFARELYDVGSTNEAAHLLREEVSDPQGVARLSGRIDHELQEFVEPRTQLINLMEEGLQL